MPAPSAWVDALFARLSARYGVAFARQYAEIDPQAVKADWGNALHGVSAEAIKAGLENLPERPPHAGQFRRLCIEHLPGEERRVFRALPAPRVAMPDAVRLRLARARQAQSGQHSGLSQQQGSAA